MRSVLLFLLFLPFVALSSERPRLDVAFVLDTTGSMNDEIDVVKERLVSIARRVSQGQPTPDVRFAVVAYRDRGDEYVTKKLAFERDLKKVEGFIRELEAAGGGDAPEDIAAALQETARLGWDPSPKVARVVFLVGDAGPQAYAGAPSWQSAITNLSERKIVAHTIGCSGLPDDAGKVFRTIAERTKGDFEHLTYRRVEHLADGRARTLIRSGAGTYEAEGVLEESEWKKGAEKLLAEGRVKPAAARPSLPRPTGGRPSAMALADSAAPARGEAEINNLDEEIASRLVKAAKTAGAEYGK